ncbi:macro domain-containing protein [Cloacibacillus sp.]|uniref:macro domain-containing protein n=1 Tax=Cloacibacillus sp. TaxID=2049023 RepID=UPI0025B7AD19|nr:macro domain-containing protein [Cloacibacillus sp.]MCC8056883.1 DUF6430 domain-containing protein [Cloacibacillus sp.]
MKVPFFDKRILHQFYRVLSAISVLTSIVFLFVDIDARYKLGIGIAVLALLVALYIGMWIFANKRRVITLKINTSEVEVKFGDIFEEQADLKAIGFNEYFDTQVDNNIISATSLHGQYIEKFYKDKVSELDSMISADTHLPDAYIGENSGRIQEKKGKYKLGTICVANDYLLTALSRFDENNKAYLEINDYINCLLNFWNEVDRVYAGRTVALPILGSGITRFKGYESITDQELLELIIWTFKVSRIKFTYPSKAKIVVYEKKSERINLLRLKDLET